MRSHRGLPPDPLSPLHWANEQSVSVTAAKSLTPPRRGRLVAPCPLVAPSLDPTDRDRRLVAQATRYPGIVPSQAWRWEWPNSPAIKPAWNRLAELTRAGLLVRVPLRRGESISLATERGARLVRDLTGGLSAPRVPAPGNQRWLGQLQHDLTLPEVAYVYPQLGA